MTATIHLGDCRDIIATLPDCSIDSIVTDPPYELGFMGKGWDNTGIAYDVNLWTQCLRVLKPGGHLLAFGGTRTYHRMASAIEDAGFEIRDSIHWLYGSGFPKSLDVSKALDKAAGAEREVMRSRTYELTDGGGYSGNLNTSKPHSASSEITAPETDAAKQWDGWGTALKPAHEPIVMARKPLIGTVAANVLQHGTGALNIDGARVEMGDEYDPAKIQRQQNSSGAIEGAFGAASLIGKEIPTYNARGRWPANVILDEDAAAELDAQTGTLTSGSRSAGTYNGLAGKGIYGDWTDVPMPSITGNSGGASRFFYCAKASKAERNAGLEGLPTDRRSTDYGAMKSRECNICANRSRWKGRWPNCEHDDWSWVEQHHIGHKGGNVANTHPTVKPLALMRYLVRLVTPPGGTVLEPFAGSGTTMAAAILEGFDVIGCELTADYLPIIEGRVAWAQEQTEPDQESLFNQ